MNFYQGLSCILAMRLTADLIDKSASFINAVKDRELDLRENRIPAIENFAVIRDQYDTVDLTDNEIRKLENFPKMTRLRNLFVSSNQICKVDPEVSKKLLALETLVLNNNKIEEFTDLDGLLECKTLKYLSLMENPINKKPHYRLRIIGMLPWLRALDFRKITMDEKKAAKNLRLGASEDVEESETMPSKRSSTRSKMDRSAAVEAPKSKRQKLSEQELEKIKKQIAEATSLEEISRLEKILETGYNL